MELTPQAIRDVRFREKLRGYHPEDVDAFVASAAATVDALQRRLEELQTPQPAAPAGAPPGAEPTDAEDQVLRTLVLAQRTADMAIREAQEEAARLVADAEAQRNDALASVDELRTRLVTDAQAEVEAERARLQDEREALGRDVASLQAYVAQERERLRIYFSEQLSRVESGVPGVEPPPPPEAPERVVVDEPGVPVVAFGDASDSGDDVITFAPIEAGGADADAVDDEDDPFLAELRRAVTDNEPLGPRDDDVTPASPVDRGDIFDDDSDGGGRFLRRRR